MTYSTCRIDALEDAAVERFPDFGILRLAFAPDLKKPPGGGHYWLPVVTDWANARDMPITYIDKSWIEVEMSADGLADFLRDTYGDENQVAHELISMLRASDRYILAAEEF